MSESVRNSTVSSGFARATGTRRRRRVGRQSGLHANLACAEATARQLRWGRFGQDGARSPTPYVPLRSETLARNHALERRTAMPMMPRGSSPVVSEGRERLVFALQQAYSMSRYDSSSLRAAIGEFARNARHRGLDLKWVLDAVQDAIDSSVFPALSDAQRRAFSEPVRRTVEEAYNHCHEGIAPRTFMEWAQTPAQA